MYSRLYSLSPLISGYRIDRDVWTSSRDGVMFYPYRHPILSYR